MELRSRGRARIRAGTDGSSCCPGTAGIADGHSLMDQRAAGFLRSIGRSATALLVACVLCASSCLPSEPYSGIGFRSDAGRATVLVLGCKQNPPHDGGIGG